MLPYVKCALPLADVLPPEREVPTSIQDLRTIAVEQTRQFRLQLESIRQLAATARGDRTDLS